MNFGEPPVGGAPPEAMTVGRIGRPVMPSVVWEWADMKRFLHIDLTRRDWTSTDLHGEDMVRAGRHLIARMLLERGVATADALSPENPLIFSAGPLAGTAFSNANRISVGCKSPLTGGIKEANSGGMFAVALGQLALAGFILEGSSDEWVVIRIRRDGTLGFDPAGPFLGMGNFEAAAALFERYGPKISFALCGPVGEYRGLLSGIAFNDREGRPGRLAARGGVGAVMGSKRVKAIVADLDKMPDVHDRKSFYKLSKDYATALAGQPATKSFRELGTAGMADFINYIGGMPVRNFRSGQLVDPKRQPLRVGGDFIRQRILQRGGHTTHGCMPGCVIQCSNVYVDDAGKEMVSPLEYETLGLMGTNCGLGDPDDIAQLNAIVNDLGVDSIETGATLGVLMEGGQAEFGDIRFIKAALEDLRLGNERGRLLAQGTARVGEHFGVGRVPVIKRQAISAYDPRVVEVTGISMMTTAQGADHTAGAIAAMDCSGKTTRELAAASLDAQFKFAVSDSMGLCIFGRSVTDANYEMMAEAVNGCLGIAIKPSLLREIGRETVWMELEFNRRAGFTADDDRLPAFFYDEALPPSNKTARPFNDVRQCMDALMAAEMGERHFST